MAVRLSALCSSCGGDGADHVSVTFIFPNNAGIIYLEKSQEKVWTGIIHAIINAVLIFNIEKDWGGGGLCDQPN
jgi:hypothetical protein